MFGKHLFGRVVAAPVLLVAGVLAISQAAQAGYCVYFNDITAECSNWNDPVYGAICTNHPVDPQYIYATCMF